MRFIGGVWKRPQWVFGFGLESYARGFGQHEWSFALFGGPYKWWIGVQRDAPKKEKRG